jgi:hypothetical protein
MEAPTSIGTPSGASRLAVTSIAIGPFAGTAMAIGSAGLWTAIDLQTGSPAGPVTAGSFALRLVGLLFIVRALQALLELLEHTAHLSWTDELTGLPNRRALISRAELELARMRRTGAPLTVAFLDVDAFKDINDRYGHERGDRILIRGAARSPGSPRPRANGSDSARSAGASTPGSRSSDRDEALVTTDH